MYYFVYLFLAGAAHVQFPAGKYANMRYSAGSYLDLKYADLCISVYPYG